MKTIYIASVTTLLFVLAISVLAADAQQKPLSADEFKKLYDSLLAGKTLITESKEDGITVRKERQYGNAIEAGEDDFEIPVKIVITNKKDGRLEQKITVDILDRVHDLGGQAVLSEEIIEITVEGQDSKAREAGGVEFAGLFRIAKNERGGFDAHSFGLIPSIFIDDDSTKSLAGTMASYSCFPEKGKTKCELTIRDYKLGGYEPLKGYTLLEPAGDDYIETVEEVSP